MVVNDTVLRYMHLYPWYFAIVRYFAISCISQHCLLNKHEKSTTFMNNHEGSTSFLFILGSTYRGSWWDFRFLWRTTQVNEERNSPSPFWSCHKRRLPLGRLLFYVLVSRLSATVLIRILVYTCSYATWLNVNLKVKEINLILSFKQII